jgi:hypothetical protein
MPKVKQKIKFVNLSDLPIGAIIKLIRANARDVEKREKYETIQSPQV